MFNLKVAGVKAAQGYLRRIADSATAGGKTVVRVGTKLVYGFGIETGRRRSGRLARRAGGAYMLTTGLKGVLAKSKGEVAIALPKGGSAVPDVLMRLGLDVERRAKAITPVGKKHGGSLRRSMHTVAGTR